MRLPGQESTIWGFGPGRSVEKETPGKFAKTSPQKVGRENPVCRQSHPPVQAGCFNLAIVIKVDRIPGTGIVNYAIRSAVQPSPPDAGTIYIVGLRVIATA